MLSILMKHFKPVELKTCQVSAPPACVQCVCVCVCVCVYAVPVSGLVKVQEQYTEMQKSRGGGGIKFC